MSSDRNVSIDMSILEHAICRFSYHQPLYKLAIGSNDMVIVILML